MTATELIIAAALLVLAWTFPKEGFDVKEDELITITCEQCGKQVQKPRRVRMPRFCDRSCSMKWQHAHGRKPPMLGRNHTDVAKQHFRQSMAKRLKEKPDTVQSWRSYKGWYKGLFFRSSYECFFMKQLEAEGLSLRDDVQQETFHIPYTVEGVVHTYIPDFYVPSRQAVYEVKSKHMSDDAVVRAKTDAAISFLASRGISYTMVTGDMLSLPKQRDIRRTLSSDPCVFLLNKLGEGDTLELLFSEQRRFMELLQTERGFPMFPVDLATKPGQKLVKDISHDCMHELFEAVHLLRNSKSHRKTDVSEFDREAFLEELADVLHYLIEVMIVAGISPKEIYEAYMKKGTLNFARILGGY